MARSLSARTLRLLLAAGGLLLAESAASELSDPEAAVLTAGDGLEYRSKVGRFAVWMPGSPSQRWTARTTLAGRVESVEYWVQQGATELRVEHHDVPAIARFLVSAGRLLERAQDRLVADDDGLELRSAETSFQGFPARSVSYRIAGQEDRAGDALLVLVGRRLYVLAALHPRAAAGDGSLERFFQSFHFWEPAGR